MAHPPPARPIVKVISDEEAAAQRLAVAQRGAKVIEGHVDAWLKGQGPLFMEGLRSAPNGFVEVSIGERGSIPEIVLDELIKLYATAGWETAVVLQDVPETLYEVVEGKDEPQPLDVSLVRWRGGGWIYEVDVRATAYVIAEPRFTLTTKPDPRGIVLHLAP